MLAALLPGCSYLRPATIPMPAERYAGAPSTERRLLLLPGRGDRSVDFERHGFIAAAREAGISADIVAADAHLGYYHDRSVAERLVTDLLAPTGAHPYTVTFAAGISLGGLGSLILAREYPDAVQGLVLIAPYLGPDELVAEIDAAGGLAAWTPRRTGDFEGVWQWLKGYSTGEARPSHYLAFG
jgi:pimeloyl-ACP methyl ester carboxylesterase